MTTKKFGSYLYTLRIKSGATTVAEYLKNKDLKISEQYYRALENGARTPAVETINELAIALGAEPLLMFRYYLEDILPASVFRKLIQPVTTEPLIEPPLKTLEQNDETLNVHRASLRKLQAAAVDVYQPDDTTVDLLRDHPEWLPFVHYIYMKEGDVSRDELQQLCKVNKIEETDLDHLLIFFRDYRVAEVIETGKGKYKKTIVKRFNRAFHLPPTDKGRALRGDWIKLEVDKAVAHELQKKKHERIRTNTTYSYATIDCYQESRIEKIENRVTDLIAELNAAGDRAEDPDSHPFFVYIVLSPRPEYFAAPVINKKSQENL